MPNVRYYDYGIMRNEADRRMYDAQRRAGRHDEPPVRRVLCDGNTQARPEPVTEAVCGQDAPESDDIACAGICDECRAEAKEPAAAMQAEELLIAAILMLALCDGKNMPLVLVLFYLLM